MTNEERVAVWEAHVAAWRASGLPQSVFCREHGLKEHLLGYWIRRGRTKSIEPAFLPVKASTAAQTDKIMTGINLRSPSGWAVQIPSNMNMATLSELLRHVP